MDDYLLFRRRDSRLALIALAHRAGDYATVAMSAGAIITGLTVLSSFTAVRVYLFERFGAVHNSFVQNCGKARQIH